jgi:hypothetical protein
MPASTANVSCRLRHVTYGPLKAEALRPPNGAAPPLAARSLSAVRRTVAPALCGPDPAWHGHHRPHVDLAGQVVAVDSKAVALVEPRERDLRRPGELGVLDALRRVLAKTNGVANRPVPTLQRHVAVKSKCYVEVRGSRTAQWPRQVASPEPKHDRSKQSLVNCRRLFDVFETSQRALRLRRSPALHQSLDTHLSRASASIATT